MDGSEIRLASPAEYRAVARCVDAAYAMYGPRIGKKPAPMLADYAALISAGSVYVIPGSPAVRGILVVEPRSDHIFIENIAVHPDHQGAGLGRQLMRFVEEHAIAHQVNELRLYTHELMIENLSYYAKLGYEEVERRVEDGYSRIFMRKRLARPPN
jgi:ribosomal protein S18 acetylase RimI-like enzyme